MERKQRSSSSIRHPSLAAGFGDKWLPIALCSLQPRDQTPVCFSHIHPFTHLFNEKMCIEHLLQKQLHCNWFFSVIRELADSLAGCREDRPVGKQFEAVINAMIRVTIRPSLPGSVPVHTCCPCIICTGAPCCSHGGPSFANPCTVPLVKMGSAVEVQRKESHRELL